jgi:hypothetical protein
MPLRHMLSAQEETITRQDFFKGRPDVSPNRLDSRQIQADYMKSLNKD